MNQLEEVKELTKEQFQAMKDYATKMEEANAIISRYEMNRHLALCLTELETSQLWFNAAIAHDAVLRVVDSGQGAQLAEANATVN